MTDGPAAGCRAIDVRVEGGIDVRILPDRGFDIGVAWFRGKPLAWTSAVGEAPPIPAPKGDDWLRAFGGGLVTTCGLDNVGAPSEGVGLHGTFSHLSATDVRLTEHDEGIDASARIVDADALERRRLEVERRITTERGFGSVMLEDVTRNLGTEPAPAPVLYHVNLRFLPGAHVEIASEEVVPRDDDAAPHDWRPVPAPDRAAPERVWEHLGASAATVFAEGIRIHIGSNLPRLWQWVHPALGVLGIEPANCSVLGRAHDRAEGRMPILEPGEERTTRITIHAEVE